MFSIPLSLFNRWRSGSRSVSTGGHVAQLGLQLLGTAYSCTQSTGCKANFFPGQKTWLRFFLCFYPILWAFPQVEESLFKIGCVYGMVRSTRRDTEEQEVRTGSSPLPPSGRPSATPGKSPCAHVQREGLSPRLSLPLPNVIRGIVDNMTLPGSLSQRFWLSCSRLETWQLFLKKYNWVTLRCGHGVCLCQDCF